MTTQMIVRNDSADSVTAYLTLGATPGCVQEVNTVMISDGVAITRLYALMGYFTLAPGQRVYIGAPGNLGFNGNFAFDTPPLNCPCPDWPEGVCLAEFIINNGFQMNGQETIDISCVCGANAFLEYEMSADDWNDSVNFGLVQLKNGTRYNNLNLSGVYPYGCDNCTASVSPPDCVGVQTAVNDQPICNVQRNASGNQGGTVTVVFKGFTPIPA